MVPFNRVNIFVEFVFLIRTILEKLGSLFNACKWAINKRYTIIAHVFLVNRNQGFNVRGKI